MTNESSHEKGFFVEAMRKENKVADKERVENIPTNDKNARQEDNRS